MTPTAHGTGAAQRQPSFAADAVSAAMVFSGLIGSLVTLIATTHPLMAAVGMAPPRWIG